MAKKDYKEGKAIFLANYVPLNIHIIFNAFFKSRDLENIVSIFFKISVKNSTWFLLMDIYYNEITFYSLIFFYSIYYEFFILIYENRRIITHWIPFDFHIVRDDENM